MYSRFVSLAFFLASLMLLSNNITYGMQHDQYGWLPNPYGERYFNPSASTTIDTSTAPESSDTNSDSDTPDYGTEKSSNISVAPEISTINSDSDISAANTDHEAPNIHGCWRPALGPLGYKINDPSKPDLELSDAAWWRINNYTDRSGRASRVAVEFANYNTLFFNAVKDDCAKRALPWANYVYCDFIFLSALQKALTLHNVDLVTLCVERLSNVCVEHMRQEAIGLITGFGYSPRFLQGYSLQLIKEYEELPEEKYKEKQVELLEEYYANWDWLWDILYHLSRSKELNEADLQQGLREGQKFLENMR